MRSKSPSEIREKKKLLAEKKKFRESVRKDKAKFKRENSITTLSNKADDLWSLVVRKPWRCEVCFKTWIMHPHHIFSRNNKSTRWDLENGICLCPWCHVMSHKFSAHKTPTEFTYWLEKHYSREWVENLGRKANTPLHVEPEFLKATIIYLKSKLCTPS